MAVIFVFVAAFWALFDQTGSRWVLQGEKMNQQFMGWTLDPSMLQAANPLFVMIMIPLCSFVIYPLLNRFMVLTPLRKSDWVFSWRFLRLSFPPGWKAGSWPETRLTFSGR